MKLRCRAFGHRRWYYNEDGTDDFVFGCVRCKDPDEVRDRQSCVEHPDKPGYVVVDPEFFARVRARLDMLT